MGLLKKIELANNFSSVERILGKYVLENGEKVLNMSTKELAKATFTSPASIVRFCRKLEYEGYNDVRISQMINEQLFQAAQSTSEHLAILISYSGETEEVIEAAKILYRRKIPAIAITSFGENRLVKYTQRVLYLNSSEFIYSKIATFSSTLSLHLLLDIIYGCVFSKNYEDNLNYKIETDNLIDHRQSSIAIDKFK